MIDRIAHFCAALDGVATEVRVDAFHMPKTVEDPAGLSPTFGECNAYLVVARTQTHMDVQSVSRRMVLASGPEPWTVFGEYSREALTGDTPLRIGAANGIEVS